MTESWSNRNYTRTVIVIQTLNSRSAVGAALGDSQVLILVSLHRSLLFSGLWRGLPLLSSRGLTALYDVQIKTSEEVL